MYVRFQKNALKTSPLRKINSTNVNNRAHGNGHNTSNTSASYYANALSMNSADGERSNQPQIQQNSPQLQQLLQAPAQSDLRQQISQPQVIFS
jgi:hypothetical protein